MKWRDWAGLAPSVFVLSAMVACYATGSYRWLLVLAIWQCISQSLFYYFMIHYRDMMCEYRSDYREARDRALRAEIASDRKRLRGVREGDVLYSWEANPAQDASKEPWRRES